MEEKQKEKSKIKLTNTTKWTIFVSIFIMVLIVTTIMNISSKHKSTVQVGVGEKLQENVEENIREQANIGELTETKNKTEEELKKINEKELEENQKKQNNKKTTNTTTKVNQKKYYIKVNYGAQVVNVYTYDKNGKYTVPVKAFVCSTGAATPTSGVYKIPAKITWCHLYGNVWGHYSSQIVGDILFHSVPYLEAKNNTLVSAYYDRLGTKDSMGCIRLTVRDAKWIFDNVSVGSSVEFYSSSNPGPFGKPSAQKISSAPKNLRVWDPTDPDPKNPWRTYKPSNNTIENNVTMNNVITNNATNNTIINDIINNTINNNTIMNNAVDNNVTGNNTISGNEQNNTQGSGGEKDPVGNNQEQGENGNHNNGQANNSEIDNNIENNEMVNEET